MLLQCMVLMSMGSNVAAANGIGNAPPSPRSKAMNPVMTPAMASEDPFRPFVFP